MRLSADHRSQYYDPAIVPRAKVYLNGIEQKMVTEVDDEAGWLKRCKVDAEGRVVENRAGDGVAIETLRGAVRIDIEDSYTL